MLSCVVQAFAYDFEVDGIYYDKSGSEATVTYANTNYNSYSGIVTLPAAVTYGGVTYNVTRIGYNAFYNCSGLTSITISSSVTSISAPVFSGCSGLTSIIVASGNTKYDSRENCNAIIKTESNTLIDGCKNTVIPNSVTSIGSGAFEGCTGLTSITIPNSVTSIGTSAFRDCSGLTSITIPSSVKSLVNLTIYNCSGLASITVEEGNTKYDSRENCNAIIETASNRLIAGCKNTVIPNSVTSIKDDAFYGCSGLTSITIPNNVTSIGNSVFENCM